MFERAPQDLGTTNRVGHIKESMVTNPGGAFPKLKTKAAETRHIGEPILQMWRDFSDGSEIHNRIERVLELSVSLETIQANSKRFLQIGKQGCCRSVNKVSRLSCSFAFVVCLPSWMKTRLCCSTPLIWRSSS
jgi:hypothetical protein